MRFANSGSRTARVPTLVEAIALRDTWSIERDQLLKEAMLEKTAAVPVFSIVHGEVFVEFDQQKKRQKHKISPKDLSPR